MTQTIPQNQLTLNLESTQQALNQLRNLREKRKRENPSSIYDMVKAIYSHIKQPIVSKVTSLQTINAKDYLGNSRDSIEEMLAFIKSKICGDTEFQVTYKSLGQPHQINQCPTKLNQELKIPTLQNLLEPQTQIGSILKQKQHQIQRLQEQINILEQTNKSMQIKLLNNLKRLTLQIQQKDVELKQVRKILHEKEQEIEDMCILNEKKHKKMRKLEEDIYDLRLELAEKNDELEAERDCADFLEKKVDKLMSFPSQAPYTNSAHDLKIAESNTQTSENISQSEL